MDDNKPPTVEEIDELSRIKKDSTRFIAFTGVVLAALVLVIIVGGGIVLDTIIHHITAGDSTTCSFYGDLADIPLIVRGPNKTTTIGTKLIADSYNTYVQRGCLPKKHPTPSLSKLAKENGITLRKQ